MNDIKSADQLALLLGYVVPGLIIVWFRAQFLTGRIGPTKDSFVVYLTLSVTYVCLLNALVTLVTGSDVALDHQTRYWLPIELVGAAVFGIIVGCNSRFGWTRRMVGRLGVNLPHVIGPAWDWKFSQITPSMVVVVLKDGSTVQGWCGAESFIGSDPDDRDLYLEQVYEVDDLGTGRVTNPGKGIYIAANEVRTIEFLSTSAKVGGESERGREEGREGSPQ